MSLQLCPQMAYQRLLATISGRSTSRPDDETVVLASFLDMDTNPIIQEPTPERRMIRFMQMLPFIPTSVVFAWGPRLCIEDSSADRGWVPATILAPYGVDDLIIDNEIPLDLSKPDKMSDRPASYIHPAPEHGLATFFPGILITHSSNDVAAPFTISTPSGRFIVHDAAYDYSPTGTGRLRPWTFRIPGLHSALILSSFNPSNMRQEPALLVHFTSYSEGSELRRVFISRVVRVTTHDMGMYTPRHLPIEDADTSNAALEGELINPKWWLVNPFPADYEKEKRH